VWLAREEPNLPEPSSIVLTGQRTLRSLSFLQLAFCLDPILQCIALFSSALLINFVRLGPDRLLSRSVDTLKGQPASCGHLGRKAQDLKFGFPLLPTFTPPWAAL
jgi:hypothetical protein